MVRVEIERDVLENIYKALHWYVSRECDYNRVTEDLLSDMNKVATILSSLKREEDLNEKWMKFNEDFRNKRYVWIENGVMRFSEP